MSSFLHSDAHSDSHPDRNDSDDAQRKHALREVARVAMVESLRGAHFGPCDEPIQTLRSMHERIQELKAQGVATDDATLGQLRNKRAHQASYVGQLLVGIQGNMSLPPRVERAITEFLALDQATTEMETSTESPILQGHAGQRTARVPEDLSDAIGEEEVEDPEVTAEEEEADFVRIHGLDAIPPCGVPLQVLTMPEAPVTWDRRLKDRYDNADYWYQQHRSQALLIASVVAALMFVLNVVALTYIGGHETNYVSAPAFLPTDHPRGLDGESQGPAKGTAASEAVLKNQAGESSGLRPMYVLLFGGLAALVAYLLYRSRIRNFDFARRYSLAMVKAVTIPVDVAVQRGSLLFYQTGFPEDRKPSPPKRARTLLERRVRAAQFAALVLLALTLVFPVLVHAAQQYRAAPSGDTTGLTGDSGDSNANAADGQTAEAEEALRTRIRSQYIWLTAGVLLILVMLLLGYFLRKVYNRGKRSTQAFWTPRGESNNDKGAGEHKPWTHVDGSSESAHRQEEIDHEDPYGAMVRAQGEDGKVLSLRQRFKIEAMIARYRIFNRWRIISVFALLFDTTFRFLGVVVFGAMLLLSVVMPMVMLTMFKDKSAGEIAAIRETVQELFPELIQDQADQAVSDSPAEVGPGGDSSAPRLTLVSSEVPVGTQGRGWAWPYAITLAAMAGINLLLLGARLMARRRSREHVAGTNWRMSAEAAVASLVVISCMWLLDMNFTSASTLDTGARNGTILEYRTPSNAARVQVLTEEKFFSHFLLPESTYPNVWYVDAKSGSSVRDGRSWNTAFHTIYGGLNAASNAGGGEVWVAGGWYSCEPVWHDRSEAYAVGLSIPQNVHVYGGFAGAIDGGYERSRLERNWQTNLTILDLQSGGNSAGNAFYLQGLGEWTLDGFVLLGGSVLSAPPLGMGPLDSQVTGVVGNSFWAFPREPFVYRTVARSTRLLFHHDFVWRGGAPEPLAYRAFRDSAGPCAF